MNSAIVVAGADALASEYNNLRKDLLVMAGDRATSTGSANAYLLTIDSQLPTYAANQKVRFSANFTNTGACTIAINGQAAKAIKKNVSTDLDAGDITSGQEVELEYDGTNFQIMSSIPTSLAEVRPLIQDYVPNTFNTFGTKFSYTLHPSSNEGWTATAGETRLANGVKMQNATANAIASAIRGQSASIAVCQYNDGIDFTIAYIFIPAETSVGVTPAAGGDKWWYHGFGNAATSTASGAADITDVNARIGFAHYNGRIYAICADDAAVTATDLMADPGQVKKVFTIEYISSTSAKFYYNGTLMATITTNIPAAVDMGLAFAGYNGSGSDPSFFLSCINVSETIS